jgi:hypothetical protein
VGPTNYTYTVLAEDSTDILLAKKIARMLNDIPQLDAISDTDTTNPAVIWVRGRIDGLDLTLANGGGTTTLTVTAKQAAARSDAIQFGAPAAGVIAKETTAWQGTAVADGTAGYFRIVTTADDDLASTTYPRAQGIIASSGGEVTANNAILETGAPVICSSFSIEFPEK